MPGEQLTFEVEYTEAMLRDAVRHFVWRRAICEQAGMWIAGLVGLAAFIYLLSIGDYSFLTGVMGAVLLLIPTMIAAVWVAHLRNTVGKFRRMKIPTAKISIGDSSLSLTSELGTAELPWRTFTELWERPSHWMLFTAPSSFMTFPIAQLPVEARELLRSRIAGTPR